MKHDLFFEDGVSVKDGEYKNRLHGQLETIQAELEQLSLEFVKDEKDQTANMDEEYASIRKEPTVPLNHSDDHGQHESENKKQCSTHISVDASSKANTNQISSPNTSSRNCNTPNGCHRDTGTPSLSHYDSDGDEYNYHHSLHDTSNSLSLHTISSNQDTFTSITERTTNLITELEKLKRSLYETRRLKNIYMAKFKQERSKVEDLSNKYMTLLQGAEQSNDYLRATLESKENVCQHQAEVIRCLQESNESQCKDDVNDDGSCQKYASRFDDYGLNNMTAQQHYDNTSISTYPKRVYWGPLLNMYSPISCYDYHHYHHLQQQHEQQIAQYGKVDCNDHSPGFAPYRHSRGPQSIETDSYNHHSRQYNGATNETQINNE